MITDVPITSSSHFDAAGPSSCSYANPSSCLVVGHDSSICMIDCTNTTNPYSQSGETTMLYL